MLPEAGAWGRWGGKGGVHHMQALPFDPVRFQRLSGIVLFYFFLIGPPKKWFPFSFSSFPTAGTYDVFSSLVHSSPQLSSKESRRRRRKRRRRRSAVKELWVGVVYRLYSAEEPARARDLLCCGNPILTLSTIFTVRGKAKIPRGTRRAKGVSRTVSVSPDEFIRIVIRRVREGRWCLCVA